MAANDSFTDISGKIQNPLKPDSVLIFFWQDCPICNSYSQEINRQAARHTNFNFYIVQVDPDLTVQAARKHAAEYKLAPPVLLDPKHQLVHLTGTTTTPEAVVIGPNKAVLYRGRIDNLYPALNQRRAEATEHDLAEALDAIAAGKSVKKQHPPMGCLIQ